MKKERFNVIGMGCAGCAANIQNNLRNMEGVISGNVNFTDAVAVVEYDENRVSADDICRKIKSIGYEFIVEEEASEEVVAEIKRSEYHLVKKRAVGSLILAFFVFMISMFVPESFLRNIVLMFLSLGVVVFFGRSFYANAYRRLLHRTADMDTLVAMSTGIAFLFSVFNTFNPEFWTVRGLEAHVYFEAVAVIIALVSLGRWMESRAKANTMSAIKKLMGMQPQTVAVLTSAGQYEVLPVDRVRRDDLLMVRPGERIPVDGILESGTSYVDESTITGESFPAKKQKGSTVYAGTLNTKGSFVFKALQVGEDTVFAGILKAVREAQGSKAPVQRLADRIASVFVPVVLGISILTFFVWWIVGGTDLLPEAVLSAVTVSVIACPCALGLATPTAVMVGIGKGAENRILIRNAGTLEGMRKVTSVVLDKTGTLTEGHPSVLKCKWHVEDERLKSLLLSVEMKSQHPFAEAIVNHIGSQAEETAMESFDTIVGKGVSAVFEGRKYYVGSIGLAEEKRINIPEDMRNEIRHSEENGASVVLFFDESHLLAEISIVDKIRDTAVEAVKELRESGYKVYMLTGDRNIVAEATGKRFGFTAIKAEMLPGEKAAYIKNLQEKGEVVAMVGDGINDTEAFAGADMSIAMGKGSDIAMDVAEVTLITSDLRLIRKAFALSEHTLRTIKQNLFWAFIYNIIGIPIAAGILFPFSGFLLNPMIASAAMAFSSVSVVSNSLRLKSKSLK